MIKNGYYYPVEIFKKLNHLDENNEIVGQGQMAILLGNRTAGKTVSIGIEILKRYENLKERALILARTKDQKDVFYLRKWWEKILCVNDSEGVIEEFKKKHNIDFTKDYMIVDNDIMCYCESISMSQTAKDAGSYNHCTLIVLDEAIQKGERYLQINKRPAMERIFEIWQTVGRGYENAEKLTNIIFIANTSDRDNWIFNDLGINSFLRADTKFTVHNGIIVEIVKNENVSEKVATSYMGQIMQLSRSGATYYENAQENKFSDNRAFVKPMGLDFKNLKIQFCIRDCFIGIFKTATGYHIAKINKDSRSRIICNNIKYHTEEIDYEYYGEWEKTLRTVYNGAYITFQDLESKGLFLEFIRLL